MTSVVLVEVQARKEVQNWARQQDLRAGQHLRVLLQSHALLVASNPPRVYYHSKFASTAPLAS